MKRYIQDRVTHKLIPIEDYVPPTENRSALVIPDIQPYQSMLTGEMITGRAQHRAHLKAHGCIEIGNENPIQKQPEPKSNVKQDLIRAYEQISRR